MSSERRAHAAERHLGITVVVASLLALASIEGARGLAAAAAMWIIGLGLIEHARRA